MTTGPEGEPASRGGSAQRSTCGVLLLLLAGCEPSVTAPVKVMAIVANNLGTYDTRQVELTTPDTVVHLSGKLLTVVGGAHVEINPDELQSATSEAQQLELAVKNKGGSVRANFIDRGGVLVPADFHSWAMTTTFYNFEQAFLYYQKVYDGKPTDELKNLKVYYWAGFKYGAAAEERDNALFHPLVKAFMILPFQELQKVPLSLNIGVIGHEYAHLVFNKKVFSGASVPAPLNQWTGPPFNLLKSMDEGFADFHAYGVNCATAGAGFGCKSSLLSDSYADPVLVALRDIQDDKKCMTPGLRSAFKNTTPDLWLGKPEMYQLGNLIAVALYHASEPLGKLDVMQKALINALDNPSSTPEGFRQIIPPLLTNQTVFTPELMADTIAAHITDLDLRRQVCKQLSDRLQLDCPSFPCASMPHCDTATRGTSCAPVPQ